MWRKYCLVALIIFTASISYSQYGGRGGGFGASMQTGRFYGKIVDAKTGKPLEAASVQLVSSKFDFTTRKKKDSIINGQLTESNGDFSLDNIPFIGEYHLKITAIGFKTLEEKVSFLTPDQQQKLMQAFAEMRKTNQTPKDSTQKGINKNEGGGNMMNVLKKIFGDDMSQLMGMTDKDLGNIKLEVDAKALANVTVVANAPVYTLGIDRKIFNVEKSLTSQGQTAIEIMRQIPSLNVDIDGNVTLRNASPTIFVDGRPTTLQLDQIPADAIQNVEIITNPSAKFDASGGTASILNIVMKKNRKNGYNGSVRAGVDQRGRFNGGGDFNMRSKKINAFVNGHFGQRKSIAESDVVTNYNATTNSVASTISQNIDNTTKGNFRFIRPGFDYFLDNRNTFTIAGTFTRGKFNTEDVNTQQLDSFYNPIKHQTGNRTTNSDGIFRNTGGTLSYKHNFTQPGHELTADINYNHSNSNNNTYLQSQFYDNNNTPTGNTLKQKTEGSSTNDLTVIQMDYSNPINKDNKVESGLRTQIRNFSSSNYNYYEQLGQYVTNDFLNSNYKFTDQVYAAYITYTAKKGKFGYNIGLRAESSNYDGTQIKKTDSSFKVNYPISLFPSAFLSYKINEKQDVQLNYTRRINRPNFFQLLPFYNYTDPLNLSVGNAGLKPEFTNSLEANYSYQINNGNSILISGYYKYTTNLITRSFDTIINPVTHQRANLISFINADNSSNYGLELTSRNNITKQWDITTNLNFYNATINSTSFVNGQSNSRFSFFGKINTNYKLGKNNSWTIQLSGDYQGRTVIPAGGSSGFGGGGGGGRGMMGGGMGGFFMGGGNQSAGANGYVNPSYGVDLAIKKEFLKNKAASITLSVNDIFKTKVRDTYMYTDLFNQSYITRRDQQIFRLQFAWRFGKQDVTLFKRKNLKGEMEGLNEGMGGAGMQNP